jgi:hypothetical protein
MSHNLHRGRVYRRCACRDTNGRQVDWQVPVRLIRRLDPTVAQAARRTVDTAGARTADLLADAWRLAYGRQPKPNEAYRQAVRAVDSIAGPLVLPRNPRPSPRRRSSRTCSRRTVRAEVDC